MDKPFIAALLLAGLCSGAAGEDAKSSGCAGAEHRRLDFWAGDWDVYEVGGGDKPVARARVEIILGGCALREIYQQADGLIGESYTTYDASRKMWHQTWVTNRGALLQIDGHFEGNRLTLQGTRPTPDGRREEVRGIWMPREGGVGEIAHTSTDGGKTWRPWFDIVFRRHKETSEASAARTRSGTPQSEDGAAVARLDTQYQEAVKNNDAATMDRILADDFVLVTGRGKAYGKADLLEEARKKTTVYEHQEELEQRVRVWGDTAVVTALLWVKGTSEGKVRDYKLWFSDTYVRTPSGWKYAFGQASLPLPKE